MIQLAAVAVVADHQHPSVDIGSPFLLLGVGLAIGVGLMILVLAKWGHKIFFTERNHSLEEETPLHSIPCKYAKDQSMIKKYMEDQDRERKDMWQFLGNINNTQLEMKGKLDLLLQGARVRWNQGLIPPEDNKR